MITPRDYQLEALEALNLHMKTKQGNPCCVIPTGGGKSILMAWIIQQWKEAYPPFRVIILAHRKELVEQNSEELTGIWPDGDIGVYSAALKRRDQENDIIYASIDSVYNKWGQFPAFNVIIVDEAHRIPAKGEGKYRQFIKGCQKMNPKVKVIGFTATPFRMGCGPICHRDHILNEICYEANVADLITQGYLCKLRSKVGDVQADLANVKRNSGGDYIINSLGDAVDTPEIVQKAIRSLVGIIQMENRKSIILYCVHVKHCQDVTIELRRHGIQAMMITGKTSIKERHRVIESFKAGRLRVLVNVSVYTEGLNAKRVDCIGLLRPTLSPGLYYQMVGRGLRTHESKKDCLVLDFGNCIESHGPIDMVSGGEARIVVCVGCGDAFSRAIRICPNCGWEIPKQEVERMEAEDKERKMHEERASNRSILSDEPETFGVDSVTVHRHKKAGKPDSLRVQYRRGINTFVEWVCLDHEGYAGEKARQWWGKRFGVEEAKTMTVDEAMDNMFLSSGINDVTDEITVRRRGKHTEIVDYKINKVTNKELTL